MEVTEGEKMPSPNCTIDFDNDKYKIYLQSISLYGILTSRAKQTIYGRLYLVRSPMSAITNGFDVNQLAIFRGEDKTQGAPMDVLSKKNMTILKSRRIRLSPGTGSTNPTQNISMFIPLRRMFYKDTIEDQVGIGKYST